MTLTSIDDRLKLQRAKVRTEFIDHYAATFLASYAAANYIDNCQRGWPNREQPIEDAYCLAEEAWEQVEKAIIEKTIERNR